MITGFERNFSACVTGHRFLDKKFSREKTENFIKKLVERGFSTFYVGMALGFDTICFQILEELRKTEKLKIIACIPCVTQAEKFSISQKKEYVRMLDSADEKIYVSREYTVGCMQKRNEYMVDHSSVVLAYMIHDRGGTSNTIKYALKKGLPVINMGDF